MKIVCLIPARGGSKSLPRKNINLLAGRPLIDYSIKYSINCSIVNRTIVSTDDDEIAKIARSCGADVPFIRPLNLAMDQTQDFPVMKHCLDYLESNGEIYDYYILLRPTSPLRKPGLIEEAIDLIKSNPKASSVRAVAIADQHPYRIWRLERQYIKSFITSKSIVEPYNIPRQLLPEAFFQTGDIEVIRRETILNGSVSGDNILPLVISDYIDIDNKKDIHEAEQKIRDTK